MGALEATMELQGENHRSCASPGFPPAPPFQGTLENRGLTSYRCAEMIWCLVLHIGNLNCEISVQATKYYIVAMF